MWRAFFGFNNTLRGLIMSTDLRNGKNRDRNGRFIPGNSGGPGRPPGCDNHATADAKRVRQEIIDSWFDPQINGQDILRRLAQNNPAEYVRIVSRIIPREYRAEFIAPDIDRSEVVALREKYKDILLEAQTGDDTDIPCLP